jgi:hypothetical protein
MNRPTMTPQEIEVRRKRARRLALWIAVVAVAVYAGFIALVGLSQ